MAENHYKNFPAIFQPFLKNFEIQYLKKWRPYILPKISSAKQHLAQTTTQPKYFSFIPIDSTRWVFWPSCSLGELYFDRVVFWKSCSLGKMSFRRVVVWARYRVAKKVCIRLWVFWGTTNFLTKWRCYFSKIP